MSVWETLRWNKAMVGTWEVDGELLEVSGDPKRGLVAKTLDGREIVPEWRVGRKILHSTDVVTYFEVRAV